MRTTSFDNLTPRQITLGIEPWGFAYEVPPDGTVEIEYEPEDDMELAFAIVGDDTAVVSISASRLVVRSSGVVLFELR